MATKPSWTPILRVVVERTTVEVLAPVAAPMSAQSDLTVPDEWHACRRCGLVQRWEAMPEVGVARIPGEPDMLMRRCVACHDTAAREIDPETVDTEGEPTGVRLALPAREIEAPPPSWRAA